MKDLSGSDLVAVKVHRGIRLDRTEIAGTKCWTFPLKDAGIGVVRCRELAEWMESVTCAGSLMGVVAGRSEGMAEIDRLVPAEAIVGNWHSSLATSKSPAPDFSPAEARPEAAEIENYFAELRRHLEEVVWPRWQRVVLNEPTTPPGMPRSFGMCRISTAFAAAVLAEDDPEGGWEADGGHPTVLYGQQMAGQFKSAFKDVDGGMWDRERESWDGHYWLRGRRGDENLIADLTADQFGWKPVEIVPVADERYRASYRKSTVAKDMSTRSIRAETGAWLVGWRAWRLDRGVEFPTPETLGAKP
jgi:hypothetical protein